TRSTAATFRSADPSQRSLCRASPMSATSDRASFAVFARPAIGPFVPSGPADGPLGGRAGRHRLRRLHGQRRNEGGHDLLRGGPSAVADFVDDDREAGVAPAVVVSEGGRVLLVGQGDDDGVAALDQGAGLAVEDRAPAGADRRATRAG